MTNLILASFREWIQENKESFIKKGMSVDISESPNDIEKTSIRVDFDGDDVISRITIWETGECFIEAMDVDSEETIVSDHITINESDDLEIVFRPFFERIN